MLAQEPANGMPSFARKRGAGPCPGRPAQSEPARISARDVLTASPALVMPWPRHRGKKWSDWSRRSRTVMRGGPAAGPWSSGTPLGFTAPTSRGDDEEGESAPPADLNAGEEAQVAAVQLRQRPGAGPLPPRARTRNCSGAGSSPGITGGVSFAGRAAAGTAGPRGGDFSGPVRAPRKGQGCNRPETFPGHAQVPLCRPFQRRAGWLPENAQGGACNRFQGSRIVRDSDLAVSGVSERPPAWASARMFGG